MSMSKVIFVSVCLVGLTQLVWSQNGSASASGQTRGIPGYLDPRTGAFTAKLQPAVRSVESPDAAPTALTEVYGKWNIVLTIQVTTALATGDTIGCEGDLEAEGAPSGYSESGVTLAKVSGGTATCTVSIPYAWYFSAPTTDDTVGVSYGISIIHLFTQGSVTEAKESRTSSHFLGTFSLPANGAQTNTTASARL